MYGESKSQRLCSTFIQRQTVHTLYIYSGTKVHTLYLYPQEIYITHPKNKTGRFAGWEGLFLPTS